MKGYQNSLNYKSLFSFTASSHRHLNLKSRVFSLVSSSIPSSAKLGLCSKRDRVSINHCRRSIGPVKTNAAYEKQGEISDEDEDLCPVECVKEFKTDEELFKIFDKAKETNSLVVVDFYRTSCGSCKYIEQGFAKLCRGSGDEEAAVVFLKHNVLDEYDEQSEVADRLRIKTVPLFHFYKNGVLLEAFPTRDKERIIEAIRKYTYSDSQVS